MELNQDLELYLIKNQSTHVFHAIKLAGSYIHVFHTCLNDNPLINNMIPISYIHEIETKFDVFKLTSYIIVVL